MKTTNFFIELLVIGIGAIVCIILGMYTLFDFDLSYFKSLSNPLFVFPISAIIYVLGIVFDRIFDVLTEKFDKKIRAKFLSDAEYNTVRGIYYDDSPSVQQIFDYSRSRIRISRSWMFYFMILALLSLILYFIKGNGQILAVSIFLFLLSVASVFAWRKLSHSFNGLLEIIYKLKSIK